MKALFLLVIVLSAIVSLGVVAQANPLAPAREKALALAAKLTLAQKLSLLHGAAPPHSYVGQTRGFPELGIPPLHLQDGPQALPYSAPFLLFFLILLDFRMFAFLTFIPRNNNRDFVTFGRAESAGIFVGN